jgi:transcriptional regulator with XRE-family HTH domain
MKVTDVIKALRGAGLSQSEISRRTGIPQPRLSRWENGCAPESADDALKLLALWRKSDADGEHPTQEPRRTPEAA